ncbi:MAG: DUF262 domain-containing protein [Pseudomonadota bacterium]
MSWTLADVLRKCSFIQIPMLQRDFAQGRASAKAIRERFVSALHEALTQDPEEPPLDLDFVYGSIDGEDVFRPLDGQQRLTTLFLLHWYLAQRDGCAGQLRELACVGANSRFGYDIRPSSRDFFNALVSSEVDLDALGDASDHVLSDHLKDTAWFFQSWKQDPTIQSCLTVLDTLHQVFNGARGLYSRLVDAEQPAITFQFLDLQSFGLTDDLYIKMNARGKPLTTFETFKANLEQRVARLFPEEQTEALGFPTSLQDYVSRRFDGRWADFFWNHRESNETYDRQVMNAIRAAALVATPPLEENDPLLDSLVSDELDSFYEYEKIGALDGAFVQTMKNLFDRWSEDHGELGPYLTSPSRFDEQEVFKRMLSGRTRGPGSMTYSLWIQFIAWCLFLLSERPPSAFDEWMRVVVNLAENTNYNRPREFRASLAGVHALLQQDDLLGYLADPENKIEGFNRQQVREERLKAQLLRRDPAGWRPLIEQAESHGYFKGQIEFLFSFSGILERWLVNEEADWSDAEDDAFRMAFAEWYRRADAVFDGGVAPGLKEFPRKLWQRALLCEGDYLLRRGSNHGFLDNTDRDLGWKRLLRSDPNDRADKKRAIVGRVLQDVDPDDVEGSLQRIVSGGVRVPSTRFPGWRERLVEHPELLEYCHKSQIRVIDGKTIYLLRQTQRNGYHCELYTAHLFHALRSALDSGSLLPFDRRRLDEVYTDSIEPFLRLTSSANAGLEMQVTYAGGTFAGLVTYDGATIDGWSAETDDGMAMLLASAEKVRVAGY